jgi:hypothetical protein
LKKKENFFSQPIKELQNDFGSIKDEESKNKLASDPKNVLKIS